MGDDYIDNYPPDSPWILDQQGNRVYKVDPRGNLNISVSDQFTDDISLYLAQRLTTAEVIAPAPEIDASSLNIQTGGVAPVVGNFLCLKNGVRFLQVEIKTVTLIADDDYTVGLAIPLDFAFPIGSGCEVQNVDMNVNGSVTPIDFRITPLGLDAGQEWDITRIIPTMILSSAGDDGLFGNITELTNGVSHRTEDGDAGTKNLFNARVNGDFADEGFDVGYPIRSGGGGSHGMRSRISFNGPDKRGVVKRLVAHTLVDADRFNACVRDDLTGINRYRTKAQGHVVE